MRMTLSLLHPPAPAGARRPWRLLPLAAAVALCCALAPALHAREVDDLAALSLEDLLDLEIVTASRFGQRISEAPSAVQVITAEDIRVHGWRSLAEALDSLPGLYVSETGLYATLGARGQLRAGDYDTRFLLLVNGHRINDPVYSQSPVGAEFPLDMALVARIEYAPGPGSAVYGSNAFFGVINVITRDAVDFGAGELRAGTGSFGSRGLQLSLPLATAAGSTLLSLRQAESRGRDLYFPEFADTPSGGHARGLDGERVRQLFVDHRQGALAMQLVAGERRREDPVASYEQTFAAPGAGVQDRWFALGARYQRPLGEAAEASARLDVVDFRYLGDYVYGEQDEAYVNRDLASGTSVLLGAQVVSRAIAGHTLVAGAELQLDRSVVQRNFDLDPYASYLDSRQDMASWGVFVDDEIRLSPAWRFNGGLRLDRSDLGTLRASPRMALIGARANMVFKAIVGQSYRSPNAYERYYDVESDDSSQLANPALGAEHVQTSELYYSLDLTPHNRAEASVYHYRLRDLVTLVEIDDGTLMLTNAGRGSSRGAELAYTHHRESGLLLRASYAYSEVTDAHSPRPLNAPRGIARVSASLPLSPGLDLGLGARHVGRRATRAGSVEAYTVLDAHLDWTPARSPVSFALGLRNLLDERYADPVGPEFAQDSIQRRGREYRLEATWRF